ncbi:MAG: tetratricopeptide repeat protein, partial [Acidobacteria bacterium]|nr:tetratricopeptide repeat protein [Acidobacteriota bacterium]
MEPEDPAGRGQGDARVRALDPERWKRISELFEAAVRRSAEERDDLLAAQSLADPSLAEEVRRLLAADEEVRALGAHRQPIEGELERQEEDRAPSDLGPYRVLRLLGRGGMGSVYLAARADDQFERTVAIKVLRRELVSEDALARFGVERQVLARLEHPNIARLYESGVTKGGQPYLVMERIEGLPINRYCDRNRLSLRQRVELFLGVCSAVRHAHASLLVHRDLKPSNILVGEDGQPKLLDFGIAKILEEGSPAAFVEATRTHFRPMTLPYASPEQVRCETVTTASDTYSLGVILYRLLTGRSPYRLEGTSGGELERAILEQEPLAASKAVESEPASAAEARGLAPRAWARALSGDLDTILAKALRKKPERRYGGARELQEELQRVLDRRPIEARPESWSYRFGKLVERNPWASAAAATALAVLLLFGVVSGLQARRIATERDAAVAARQEAQQVTDFLVNLLKSGSPEAPGGGRDLTVYEVVERSAAKLEELSGQPALKAQVAATLSEVYLTLDLLKEAGPVLRQALEIRQQLFEPPHPAIAESLGNLSAWSRLTGDLPEAERIGREALETWSELQPEGGVELAGSLSDLGLVLYDQARFPEAEPLFRRSVEMLGSLAETRPSDLAEAHNNLAFDLHAMGKYTEAEANYRRAQALWEEDGGGDHPLLAALFNNLASVLQEQGEEQEAEGLFLRSIAMRRELYGPTHPRVAAPINKLGWMKLYQGNLSAAEELFEEALRLRVDHYGDQHPVPTFSRIARARLWLEQGRAREAEEEIRRAQASLEGKLPPDHWRRRIADLTLGGALLRQGR